MTARWARIEQPEPAPAETRSYDLVKEFVIALVVVLVATAALAWVFSAPDDKPVTIASWSNADPNDFTVTALTELDGTSGVATYGPPYNTASAGQKIGPIGLAKLAGVRHPVDTAAAFVLTPLATGPQPADVKAALDAYHQAAPTAQAAWTADEEAVINPPDGTPAKAALDDPKNPVPVMLAGLLKQAQSGALDGELLAQGGFYQSDYTKPLLFLADGHYLPGLANDKHLSGNQWGMMNETGNYPGQAWLWLYTFWYQVSPFDHTTNGDALIWGLMAVLTLVFILVPFIPGLRSIPRYVPVYRLIWRDHYRRQRERE